MWAGITIPVVDYHVHLKAGLTLEQALAKSRRDGIGYGIAVNCGKGFPIESDAGVIAFYESMKGQPCFIAMQAEGREWMQMISRKAAGLFDYIFTDSMTWTDRHGKRMRTWIAEEVGVIADPQEFMDTLVERAVGILEHEPIDIYVNPTYVPDQLAKDYDKLVDRGAHAAGGGRGGEAITWRSNSTTATSCPGAAFVKMAKAAGCKFTLRHEQRRSRRSGAQRIRPEDDRRVQAGVAGFLPAGRMVAEGDGAQGRSVESVKGVTN